MKKPYLLAGTTGLVSSLVLVACGHQFATDLDRIGPVGAWIGSPAASVSAPKGTVTMIVRPTVAEQGFKAQSLVAPYVASDVSRLRIELWKLADPAPAAPEAYVDLTQAQLGSPVSFQNLSANTTYEVRAFAYGLDDLGQEVQISDNATSYTTVNVGTDTLVDVTIRVKLGDSDFVGSGSATISIIPGGYTSTASPTITVATPAPTPTPALQATFTGGDIGTVASIVSVTGADVGDNYLLSLEKMFDYTFGMDRYTLRWGVNGNQNAVDLGTSWPPMITSVTGSAGAGTLTLQWHLAPPTLATMTATVAIMMAP